MLKFCNLEQKMFAGNHLKNRKNRGDKLIYIPKKRFLLTLCIIAINLSCFAQDIIVTKDARRINAKVTEVNVDNVRYKNFDNQDGPVYTLLKSDIASIVYQNGQVETFVTERANKSANEKPSLEYFSCIEKNPEDLIPEMKTINYALYKNYVNGGRMTNMGRAYTIFGGCTFTLGIIVIVRSLNMEDEDEAVIIYKLGYATTIVGAASLGAGIPIWIVGKNKRNSALRDYCQLYSTSSTMPHFRLNLYSNRVGLAYVF